MRHSVGKTIALVLLILSLASIGWAQYDNSNQNQNQNQNQKSKNKGNNSLDQEKPGQPAGGQAVGKDEAKAYKAFYDARNGDSMKVIELGEGFLPDIQVGVGRYLRYPVTRIGESHLYIQADPWVFIQEG